MFLLNSFSLNMLEDLTTAVKFTEVCEEWASAMLVQSEWTSAVGHADTAAVFSQVLGLPVPCNRATVSLKAGDEAIVGQYKGPRLPEGATELPEGAEIRWVAVEVQPPASENLTMDANFRMDVPRNQGKTMNEVNFYDVCEIPAEGFGQHWHSKPEWRMKRYGEQKAVEVRKATRYYGRDNSMNCYSVLTDKGEYWNLIGTCGTWRRHAGHIF